MFEFDTSVEIDRPVAEVFSYMTDPAHMTEWQSGVEAARHVDSGPTKLGSRLAEVRNFAGKRIETIVEVTAFEPDRRFEIEVVEGPIAYKVETLFSDLGGRTRVDARGRGEQGRLFRFAGPLVAKVAESQLRNDVHRLRDVLEAASGDSELPE
ncbi:MAG: SRPBCC family protein [Actinomycetota bacterium]